MDPSERQRILEWGHQMCHSAPHDFDYVTAVTLTERDLWVLGLALSVICEPWPCLRDHSIDLQTRLAEVMHAQQAIEAGREAWLDQIEDEEDEDELPAG